jgi:uncharacterized lipoprotein YbaY
MALKYASEELKNEHSIVVTAIILNGEALQFASHQLKENYEIVHKAIQKSVKAF